MQAAVVIQKSSWSKIRWIRTIPRAVLTELRGRTQGWSMNIVFKPLLRIFENILNCLHIFSCNSGKKKKKEQKPELLLYNSNKIRFCSLAAALFTDGKEAGGSRTPPREVWAVLRKKWDFNELHEIQMMGMLFKFKPQKWVGCRRVCRRAGRMGNYPQGFWRIVGSSIPRWFELFGSEIQTGGYVRCGFLSFIMGESPLYQHKSIKSPQRSAAHERDSFP